MKGNKATMRARRRCQISLSFRPCNPMRQYLPRSVICATSQHLCSRCLFGLIGDRRDAVNYLHLISHERCGGCSGCKTFSQPCCGVAAIFKSGIIGKHRGSVYLCYFATLGIPMSPNPHTHTLSHSQSLNAIYNFLFYHTTAELGK